jgi:hypothetical protein
MIRRCSTISFSCCRFTDLSPEEQEKTWAEVIEKAKVVIERAKLIEARAKPVEEGENGANPSDSAG